LILPGESREKKSIVVGKKSTPNACCLRNLLRVYAKFIPESEHQR